MTAISTALAATMIAAGVAKLNRFPFYEKLVEHLDWTAEERQVVGIVELAGGALMLARPIRRLGAGLVLAASGVALTLELRAGRTELAGARAGVMAAALLVSLAG